MLNRKLKSKSRYIFNEQVELANSKLSKQDSWIFNMILKTGIRVNELETFVNKAISAKMSGKRSVILQPQKNNNERNILIPEELLNVFRMQNTDSLLIDFSLDGEAIQKRFQKWKDILGYDISPHDLRATYITNLFVNGLSLEEVMAITGHKDIKSLLKYKRDAQVISVELQRLGYKAHAYDINVDYWKRTQDQDKLILKLNAKIKELESKK